MAFAQAVKSVRLRLLRQAATALGVFLGIAFYASVRTSQALSPVVESDPESVQASYRLQWLVFLSLLMCLVGITNSMLMSVTERYKEIGTFKCLGATDRFIVKVFFLEAALIGLTSSVAGALAGIGLIVIVRGLGEGFGSLEPLRSAWTPIAVTAASLGLLLTIVAAVLPAIQAARMPAATALRVEV